MLTITHNNYNDGKFVIPPEITHISFQIAPESIDDLPDYITSIILLGYFDKPINRLPRKLKLLRLSPAYSPQNTINFNIKLKSLYYNYSDLLSHNYNNYKEFIENIPKNIINLGFVILNHNVPNIHKFIRYISLGFLITVDFYDLFHNRDEYFRMVLSKMCYYYLLWSNIVICDIMKDRIEINNHNHAIRKTKLFDLLCNLT